MSIVKVIEVISEGSSIDGAVKSALTEASKTLKHIRQIDIDHIHAVIEDNKIKAFRVTSKVSFVVDEAIR